jgi:hypothetical protein
MRPRFTVVLPLRERTDNVGRAAVSVLAQTFGDIELLVLHDGCNGEQIDAVRMIADRRTRIVEQSGAYAVANAIAAAKGELVAVMDATTSPRPHWLARCGLLLDRSGADIVLCGGTRHHLDGTCSEVPPSLHGHLPGAVLGPSAAIAELVTAAPEGRLRAEQVHEDSDERIVRSTEPLLDWFEQAPGRTPRGDRLRLSVALEAIDLLGRSPIPDVELLARSATIGGIAAARMGDHVTARRLLGTARRLQPRELKPLMRWMVAGLPALSERVWDPQSDRDGVLAS